MSTATIDTVDLREPAATRDGLRAQAAHLEIAGRGAMNKAQLTEAVTAAIAARTPMDGTVLINSKAKDVTRALLAGDQDAIDTMATEYITIDVHPTVAAVISAVLNDFNGTRTVGRKGASALMTREFRKDYPANKRTRGKRGGRK